MKTVLKVKWNILVSYTIAMLFMVVTVSTLTGFFISGHQRDHILIAHLEFYPKLVNSITSKYPELYNELTNTAPHSGVGKSFQSLMPEMEAMRGVEAVIFYNNRGMAVPVTGSLQPVNISANSSLIKRALTGKIQYEYLTNDNDDVLKLYIPLKRKDKTYGLVLITEAGSHLSAVISQSKRTVWIFISVGGTILYLLLFYIFYHAYNSQVRINQHLRETQDVTIFALGYQAELRDLETGKHIERTSAFVEILARGLAETEKYRSYMDEDYINDLVRSAPLHDIGKVAIPDSILLKPGKLTDEEFRLMQSHAAHGSDVLIKAEHKLSFPSFFKIAIQMCMHHHEKWNGTGYPAKLKGEDIPLSARIMSLADVYDALRSERPYKKEFIHEECVSIIKKESGVSFDPDIVGIFLAKEEQFREISILLKDT